MERYLRKVNPLDKKFVFDLSNEPSVRAASFSSEPISYETHEKWFDEKLKDENCIFLILMDFFKPLGQVRVQLSDDANEGTISYSILEEERGKGLGKELLLLLEEYILKQKGTGFKLIAEVKEENLPSKKAFEGLGYQSEEKDGLRYEKVLNSKPDRKKVIGEKKRDAGFELLRVISMMMVIALHYLQKGGLLHDAYTDMSSANLAFWLVECFCLCCVNVYVLISGYYMVNSRFTFSKLFRIWGQVFFYSIGVPAVMVICGLVEFESFSNLYDILYLVCPISMGHYWFASSYVFLLLVSPLLAAAARTLSEKALRTVILLLIAMFSAIKSFLPFAVPYEGQGLDIIWFIVLFMTAAYIRLYGLKLINTKAKSLMLYIISSVLIFLYLVTGAIININMNNGYPQLCRVVTDYNFIFVFLASVGLFMLFKDIDIKNNKFLDCVVAIAPFTFGVYLLHENIFLAHRWIGYLRVTDEYGILRPVHMILSVLIVFGIGIAVDILRSFLFKGLEKLFNVCLKIYYAKREVWDYLIFGFFATVVNWVAYVLSSRVYMSYILKGANDTLNSMVSNVFAWIVAVIFAYWTNRNFVFRSETKGAGAVFKEFAAFIAARIASFVIEQLCMFVMVGPLNIFDIYAKLLVSVIVIILNYIFSKIFVFKSKKKI